MKLQPLGQAVETSEGIVQSEFGIADTNLVIQYLTDNIYSNKIGSICREIMTNARDSHIEVKRQHVPIRVTLPNAIAPTWEVRDWGPGISPDRMGKVFTQYGASTKRGNNKESGGFGIGAKTPWCYTDTFTVSTTAMEGEKLVKRTYVCTKGDKCYLNQIGTGVEIDPTDESIPLEDRGTGTTIIVNVKPADFEKFAQECFFYTEFWKIRPEIVGRDSTSWKNIKYNFSGQDWKVFYDRNSYGSQSSLIALIDGIPYVIDSQQTNLYASELHTFIYRSKLVMDFKIGELSLNLNRESLQYTQKTVDAIYAKVKKAKNEILEVFKTKTKDCKSLLEAYYLWNDIYKVYSNDLVDHITWNGVKIENSSIYLDYRVTKEHMKAYDYSHTHNARLRSKETYSIDINKNHLVLIDDCQGEKKYIRSSRLNKYLTANNGKGLTVLVPDNPNSKDFKEILKTYSLDQLEIGFLSTLPAEDPKTRVNGGKRGPICKLWEVTKSGNVDRFIKAIPQNDVYYVQLENKRISEENIGLKVIRSLKEYYPNITILGVTERFTKNVPTHVKPLKDSVAKLFGDIWAKVPKDDIEQARFRNNGKNVLNDIIAWKDEINATFKNKNLLKFVSDVCAYYKKIDKYSPTYDKYKLAELAEICASCKVKYHSTNDNIELLNDKRLMEMINFLNDFSEVLFDKDKMKKYPSIRDSIVSHFEQHFVS